MAHVTDHLSIEDLGERYRAPDRHGGRRPASTSAMTASKSASCVTESTLRRTVDHHEN